jgi:DNA-binding IclR family transcriptional regulator
VNTVLKYRKRRFLFLDTAMTINAVERALIILKQIAFSETGVGVREIARGMGISPSVAQKSIQALVAQGFARQNPETQMYELGSMAIQVGLAGLLRLELRQVARPYLQQLTEATGESSFLGVQQGDGAVYIDKVLSQTELRMDVPLGSWRPLNCTAVGKALLAYLPEGRLMQLAHEGAFRYPTPNSVRDLNMLEEEMTAIRDRGIAVDRGEYVLEAMCLAAPVRNHESEVIASVVVSGPMQRMEPCVEDIARKVKSCGDAISRALGYVAPRT